MTKAQQTALEKEVKRLMGAGMTEAEARETALYDMDIDAGKATEFDLTPEQEKATRKYRQAEFNPDKPKEKVERKRKENPGKQSIINAIAETLGGMCDSVEITNKEREMLVMWDNVKYKVVLSCPRK